MSLRMLQMLFVVSWVAWACMPLWGSVIFAALEVTMLLGIWQRTMKARTKLEPEQAALRDGLEPEARAWFDRYPFFYSQRVAAKEWGRMLRATGLAIVLLVPVFAVQALIRTDLKLLIALGPALVFFILNTMLAPTLEVDEWTKEPGNEAEKRLHDSVSTVFAARGLAAIDLSASAPRLPGPPGGAPPP
jgi:hypothetical protein